MEAGETPNSLGCPMWMMEQGWAWALEEDADEAPLPANSSGDQGGFATKFMSRHVLLAKTFMASSHGETALGNTGFLPTALSRSLESRRRFAVDLFMGLHLLLEEQKLDIMTPEYNSPGRVALRVVLCRIARWLKWEEFWTFYELGIQEDLDPRHDQGMLSCHFMIREREREREEESDANAEQT